MSTSSAIYSIAKELNVDSNRILLACKTLNINAKGAKITVRLVSIKNGSTIHTKEQIK